MSTAVIDTGGTFSMGHNSDGLLEPMYDVRHFALAAKILEPSSGITEFEQSKLFTRLKRIKLDGGRSAENISDELNTIARSIERQITKRTSTRGLSWTVDKILQDYGVEENIVTPYRIDSIDFSFEEHYPLLKKAAFEQMEQGHNVMIIGGTDSIEFYANAFAKDPEYQAIKARHPHNSVVFINSMLGFDVAPRQVAVNFSDGLILANYDKGGTFTMAPAASNENLTDIYDVSEGFVKMSSLLPRPYASMNKFGEVRNGQVHENEYFKPSPRDDASRTPPPAHYDVAPPLITKNSTGAILAYMERQPNAVVVIEGGIPGIDAPVTNRGDEERIIKVVQERASRHVPTYFVNDYVACDDSDQIFVRESDLEGDDAPEADPMRPIIPSQDWKVSPFLALIKKAGGQVIDKGTVTGVYLQALLVDDASDMVSKAVSAPFKNIRPNAPVSIGIDYIPHATAFKKGLNIAKDIAPNIVINALPGGALPARHIDDVRRLIEAGNKVFCGFKYGGTAHYLKDNILAIEGDRPNKYAAAQPFAALVESLGTISPSEKLTGLQRGI